jgi:hypothetical protein
MNTSKIADLSEILSSIAVVVTLVVLILEVRSNTDEVRASTMATIAGRTQQFNIAHMTHPEVELVWGKMTQEGDLSAAEIETVTSLVIGALKIAEESYIAYINGRLDEEVWLTRARLALAAMRHEQSREIWSSFLRYHNSFVPVFVEWLDAALIENYDE